MNRTFFELTYIENSPEEIFIFSSRKNFTYRESSDEVNKYAGFILDKLMPGDYCAVTGNNSPEFVFLILGMWQAGVIPGLINTRLTKSEIEYQVGISGCSYAFINKDIDLTIDKTPFTRFPFEPEFRDIPEKKNIIQSTDTAVIIFTSGSTGKPKGVSLSFNSFMQSVILQDNFLKQEKGDRWLASLPFYHIGGFTIITRSLYSGCSIVIPDSLRTEDLIKSIEEHNINYVSLVGSQLRSMLKSGIDPGIRMKNMLIGGGFTDEKLIREALRRNWKISRVYGSTETVSFIAAAGPDELKLYPACTGRELIPGSINVINRERKLMLRNEEGEIILSGLPIMDKYISDEKLIEEKFRDGCFLTGDFGYLNDEDFLFVLMRRSDLVVSGGENIDPREVENAIKGIEGITDVFVFGIPDDKWGQLCTAAFSGNKSYTPDDIMKKLKGKLADFKIPKKFFYLENIPRSELGKVQIDKVLTLTGNKSV